MHAPLPWKACKDGKCSCGTIWSIPADAPIVKVESGDWGDDYPAVRFVDDSEDPTAKRAEAHMKQMTYGRIDPEIAQATTAYIVQACNAYPELVMALEVARDRIEELEDELEDINDRGREMDTRT